MPGVDTERLDALAERLLRTRGVVPAGELAAEFDGSTARLAAWADALRALGAPLVATVDGYAFALDDPLDAEAIRAEMAAGEALAVEVRRVCASTRVEVRKLAPPALCLAELQTAGRGRRGTEWRQAFGTGLAFSLVAAVPRGRLDPLAIALAVAGARCLETAGYAGIRIKWPNDLYVHGAKLGGLMVEMETAAPGQLCVSLGLNVHAAPVLAGRKAAALAELGGPLPRRNRLAAALVDALLDALKHYDTAGFAAFAAEFAIRDGLANRMVALRGGDGRIEGIARGIDEFGALMLDTSDGFRLCRAGDVAQVSPTESLWAGA